MQIDLTILPIGLPKDRTVFEVHQISCDILKSCKRKNQCKTLTAKQYCSKQQTSVYIPKCLDVYKGNVSR